MDATDRLMRAKKVLEILQIGKTKWYEGVKNGTYPAPVRLGPRTVAWRESDIAALVERGIDQAS